MSAAERRIFLALLDIARKHLDGLEKMRENLTGAEANVAFGRILRTRRIITEAERL